MNQTLIEASEGFSAEGLPVVLSQRLQVGGLRARPGVQIVCGGSVLSCSVFLKNVN